MDTVSAQAITKESLDKRLKQLTEHFTKKSLGRKRISMPQIPEENLDDFLLHFADKIKVKKSKMKISDLKPTQRDFDTDKVVGMIEKQYDVQGRKYVVSKDKYLLDGHHAYVKGMVENPDMEVDVYKVNLPIEELLRRANIMKMTTKAPSKKDILDGFSSSYIAKAKTKAENKVARVMREFKEGTLTSHGNPVTSRKQAIAIALNEAGLSKGEKLIGGVGDGADVDDFEMEDVLEGIDVEYEHTDDFDIALEIALDHLTEDKNYYKKLRSIEKSFSQIENIIQSWLNK